MIMGKITLKYCRSDKQSVNAPERYEVQICLMHSILNLDDAFDDVSSAVSSVSPFSSSTPSRPSDSPSSRFLLFRTGIFITSPNAVEYSFRKNLIISKFSQ